LTGPSALALILRIVSKRSNQFRALAQLLD
jgi:hypothetical protein